MPISAEFVAAAGQALSEHCPLASQDPATIEKIKSKILIYEHELGQEPSSADVVRWTTPFELELQEQAATEAAEIEKVEARKREREAYLSGSDIDRTEAIREFRENAPKQERQEFRPAREYTQAETDRMSSTEYRRLVLGVTDRVEDKNQTAAPASNDRSMKDVLKKRILHSKKNDPMRAALRREIREGLR